MNATAVTSIEMQAGQFRCIPLAHLELSPLSVRQIYSKEGIEELAALVRAQGVLQTNPNSTPSRS